MFLEMGLYRSRIDFLVMFEVVQHFIMKTSHKSDELIKKNIKRGVHKLGTYETYEKEITVYGFLLFLESIPLPKACASHIEKILSKSPET